MSTTQVSSDEAGRGATAGSVGTNLEVIVIPVSDVDRAKEFYSRLGWRLDADVTVSEHLRLIQFNPPGSGCSIQFGKNLTSAPPGSVRDSYLVVSDIASARDRLLAQGVEVSEVFHEKALGGRFDAAGADDRLSGPAPANQSYGSFAAFSDPDGNGWLLQEVTARLPGRVDPVATSFASVSDLAEALRRAAAAHGKHEQRIGHEDTDWPDWYAEYMVREQGGAELPT